MPDHKPMRHVEVHLGGYRIADAMAEMRIWLDHYDCVPISFQISKLPTGDICVAGEFADDALAERFEREFGR